MIILWTDALFFILIVAILGLTFWSWPQVQLRRCWLKVFTNKLGLVSAVVLFAFTSIAFLDSLHFKNTNGQIESVLDVILKSSSQVQETTYSAPYIGLHGAWVALEILPAFVLLFLIVSKIYSYYHKINFKQACKKIATNKTLIPWRLLLTTISLIVLVLGLSISLSKNYHIFGTDKIGRDVFYLTMKSIRTGLLIGTITTLVMLPFAVICGTFAGYFRGFIDDVIQYIYTTISSIPAVLLIVAAVLSLQIYISNHPGAFSSMEQRADVRLLALCIILGVTNWTSLCRILRGETLKLREMDYVQAGIVLGTSSMRIIAKHIIPNLMHLILIAVVLDFSALVLAEAVLTYVGVGVDPSTISWGNMINSARLELSREPVVWWPLTAAFLFMSVLVLAANLFADAVRDGFDPTRAQRFAHEEIADQQS